jgi:hypothetical protein
VRRRRLFRVPGFLERRVLGGLLGETSKRTSVLLTAISATNTVLALLARRTLR